MDRTLKKGYVKGTKQGEEQNTYGMIYRLCVGVCVFVHICTVHAHIPDC